MNTDFRTPITYYSDIRTFMLKRRLGNDGLAALNFLWCWSAIHRANGILTGMDEERLETVSFWDGTPGKLVPTLLELEYLDQLEDGTYALHQWAETNPWAVDAINREDKARLSGMARFYPELYEELTAQGATGISKEEFARLTAEYNKRGIIYSSSRKDKKCDAYAPYSNAPIPVPSPIPEPFPKKEDEIRRASSSASEENKGQKSSEKAEKISGQSKTLDKTEMKPTQTLIPFENNETPKPQERESSINAEETETHDMKTISDEATLMSIFMEWNLILGTIGFPKVNKATHRRKITFQARLKASQERSSLAWWIALFGKIAASDFMCESAAQKANWLTIDWVLNEHNMMKILEGKYDSERPVIADIHRGHGRYGYTQITPQSSSQGKTTTESGRISETAKEKIAGIPEESRLRMSEYYRIMHGTNEGNPYEVPDVPHNNVEVPTIEAEFSESGLCHDNEVNADSQDAAHETIGKGNEDTEETPIGEMSMEEYQAFLDEQKQAMEEFERSRKEAGLFYVQ